MDSLRWAYRFVTWPVTQYVEKTIEIPVQLSGGMFARIAGVAGASAIAAAAYGAHGNFYKFIFINVPRVRRFARAGETPKYLQFWR